MRGKAIRKYWELGTPRITPAYAGKSLLHRNNQDQNEDHPRLCGEKATMRRFSCTLSGSPPPMRGKVLLYVVLQIWDRITPAYAGKSLSKLKGSLKRGDHPRLCGEKVDSTFSLLIVRGSPPPMRGKVLWYRDFCPAVGITPAYAGKSFQKLLHNPLQQDHPRLCGEKCTSSAMSRIKSGSPPPMRGKDAEPKGTDQKFRITPAYAGKSR